MRDYKAIHIIMTVLFVLLLPVAVLSADVQNIAFDREYYTKAFDRYDIPRAMGMDKAELAGSAEKLLQYIQGQRGDLDFKVFAKGSLRELFSSRDKLHMIDVKNIFSLLAAVRSISFLYITVFAVYMLQNTVRKRKLAKYCIISGFIGLLPVAILMVLMNMDFYKYFTMFHQIFFNNDLWLLDPNVDTLVNMFPQDFFSDMAFRICATYAAALGILMAVSLVYTNALRRRA